MVSSTLWRLMQPTELYLIETLILSWLLKLKLILQVPPRCPTTTINCLKNEALPLLAITYTNGGLFSVSKKGITVSQCVPINHPALIRRLVVVDITTLLDSGHGFIHHIIAIYTPWDVDDTTEIAASSKLCTSTPNSWTLLGDLNATVTQAECKYGGTDAHNHFNNFLWQSKGFDLWSACPKCSWFTGWTCKPCSSTNGGSIIDCIVTSSGCFLDSEIQAADRHHDYVPMTNHRAVIGCLILKPPNRNSAQCLHDIPTPVLNNPRIKFPNIQHPQGPLGTKIPPKPGSWTQKHAMLTLKKDAKKKVKKNEEEEGVPKQGKKLK